MTPSATAPSVGNPSPNRWPVELVDAFHAPAAWTTALTSTMISAALTIGTAHRVRAPTTMSTPNTAAPAIHNQGDGPGIHHTSPRARIVLPSVRSLIVKR